MADRLGGHSSDDRPFGDIGRDDRAGGDHGVIADAAWPENGGVRGDPDAFPYDNIASPRWNSEKASLIPLRVVVCAG